MRQRRVKTVKVIIGYKADNTPIKRPFYGRTKEAAAGRAAKWLEVHGTPTKNADILTGGGWAARWLRVYKRPDVSAATYQTTYEITVRRHILPHLGDRVMMDLTPVDIKEFYGRVSHLSQSVCDKIKICLLGILETAIDNGLCQTNPARKIKIHSTAAPHIKEVYTEAQMEIAKAWFVQAMPEVVLALETGVRRGELCGWMKSDFAPRRHLYQVARAVRRGQAGPELGEPKAHSRRTNPLSPHGQQAYDLLCARYPDSPYLLPGPDGGLMRPDTWSRRLKAEMERLTAAHPDLPQLTAHELRHTYGTSLRRHGADIYSIAKILGHRDVEVTARIYVHNELDELKRATRYTRRQQPLPVQPSAA